MGYELHITRKENWFDKDSQNDISLEEWKAYIKIDEEMRLDNFAEMVTPSEEVIRFEREGISVWNNHPNFEKVWFSWFNGKISVKNPDDEIISKMIKISKSFNAKVQGDEGEIYNEDESGKIVSG